MHTYTNNIHFHVSPMENTKHYPIIVEQDRDGIYIVSCPLFRWCHSFGATIDEAMTNIQEVISLCEQEQQDIPRPNTFLEIRDLTIA